MINALAKHCQNTKTAIKGTCHLKAVQVLL